MHTTSAVLNSFIFHCRCLHQEHAYSNNCSDQKPGVRGSPLNSPHANLWENPEGSVSTYITICLLTFHFYCGHCPGCCHLFPDCWSWLISSLYSSHCTLYLVAIAIVLKSEFYHTVTLYLTPSPPKTYSHAWKYFDVCPLQYSKCWSATR